MSLPTADDLFRPTSPDDEAGEETAAASRQPAVAAVPDRDGRSAAPGDPPGNAPGASPGKQRRRSSGRVRHDEKMTVYVTAEELLDLEHARLALRRDHGIAVDRGRLVREALAIVLADLEHHADDSDLVKRLEA